MRKALSKVHVTPVACIAIIMICVVTMVIVGYQVTRAKSDQQPVPHPSWYGTGELLYKPGYVPAKTWWER